MDLNTAIAAEIPVLRRYALKLTRDPGAADDLVQECLVRGLVKRHLWREGTNLRAWLLRILHNEFISGIRRSARQGTAVELGDIDEHLSARPPQYVSLEFRDLGRGLPKLPPKLREVILLAGFHGLSNPQIAATLGVPIGTISSRLSRGRRRLRAAA